MPLDDTKKPAPSQTPPTFPDIERKEGTVDLNPPATPPAMPSNPPNSGPQPATEPTQQADG